MKSKYEGTQFRVEPTISTYYFWMNTTKAPFDDLKVRQAVNYAVDPAALERIYAGQLAATQQILPPGMPGYKKFELYPHDMAKAKALIAEANPSDRNITVWTDNESPNDEAGTYYQDVLKKLGFNAKLKIINADNYFTVIGNDRRPTSTPAGRTGSRTTRTRTTSSSRCWRAKASCRPTTRTSRRSTTRRSTKRSPSSAKKQLGPEQEAEYAALDKAYMEQAPWAPYGNRTVSTFVSSAIDLDKVIFNPTFGQDLTSFQFK